MSREKTSGLVTLCVDYYGEVYEGNSADVVETVCEALREVKDSLRRNGVVVTEVHAEDFE